MKICLDLRPALKGKTGVGTYISNVSVALSKRFPNERYKIFSSSLRDRFDIDLRFGENVVIYDRHLPVKLMDMAFNRFRFPPLQFFVGGFDIFHSPSPTLPPLLKCKKIVNVHDLYFLKEPENSQSLSRNVFAKQIAKHLEMADGIICGSNYVAEDVMDFFKIDRSKIRVIYHGSDHIIENGRKSDKKRGRAVDLHYKDALKKSFLKNNHLPCADKLILFVGTLEPRKNPELLLEAFEKIIAQSGIDANLVYAGGIGWGVEKFIEKLNKSKVKNRILITGYQKREDLNDIYRIADVLVMPSREEGFGFPLIEAMKLGVPIAAAGCSSIPEIGGDAALYFNNRSPEELVDTVQKIFNDSDLRKNLIEKGKRRSEEFTWEKAAEKTMSLYREVMGFK